MFYNTTSIKGEELKKAWGDAKTQTERVRMILIKKGVELTASEILEYYKKIYEPILITSVRRCLSDLAVDTYPHNRTLFDKAQIVNTRKTKPGPWGKPEFLFKAI